jgi:hypothetical protein
MVSMTGQAVSVPELKNRGKSPRRIIEFPVVVCNSFHKMYAVDFYADPEPTPIKDNFELEVRYAYTDKCSGQCNEYFLLDLVEFDQLEKFTQVIDEDAELAKSVLER